MPALYSSVQERHGPAQRGRLDGRDSHGLPRHQVKEGKQAEFLVKRFCPWSLSSASGPLRGGPTQVLAALEGAAHQPPVDVRPHGTFEPAMIEYKQGDILKADAEALVNTVNCVGVMGRGIALHFKHAYPANFKAYAAACKRGEVQPGRMFVYDTGQLAPRWIINFPTKGHWRGKSRIEDIESGLDALVRRSKLANAIGRDPAARQRPRRARLERSAPDNRGRIAELPEVRVIVYEPGGRSEATPGPRPR